MRPELADRIVSEAVRSALGDTPCLIFIRGELGIGKSVLAALLQEKFEAAGKIATDHVANALLTAAVLEAGDLETPTDFARRVNEAAEGARCVVALARPGTLDAAAQWVRESPTASATMRPFTPTTLAFSVCLREVGRRAGFNPKSPQMEMLSALASRFPPDLQTPFYFHEIANFVKTGVGPSGELRTMTPLELFRRSLERRIGQENAFEGLIQCAFGRKDADTIGMIAGIVDSNGFTHDGYRNVVLAVGVLYGPEPFSALLEVRNPVPAVKVVLDHIIEGGDRDPALLDELRRFVLDEGADDVPHKLFVQGLVAAMFRRIEGEETAETLRKKCLRMIEARGVAPHSEQSDEWWDVSDVLSFIDDPRLRRASREKFGPDSGFFTYVPESDIEVGSDYVPARIDSAKPVLPYRRTRVQLGPLWVSNFLVTNDLFGLFWSDPDRDAFFDETGLQWLNDDSGLLSEIEAAFSVAADRCFWKEKAEQQSIPVAKVPSGMMSVLEVAQQRALRRGRVALWDPTHSDDRFSARGNPVVGITWWEATAFCNWWTGKKVNGSGFPSGSTAALLTDWEWEALRRRFYEGPDFPDGPIAPPDRYPAHLRRTSVQRTGRVHGVMRPLHVGLAPVPRGPGPFDMVGNVWEWTRSRVFGRIVESEASDPPFGCTAWDDIDSEAEQDPSRPERDAASGPNDLSYRAVRGGSFFSVDPQTAWHPAYRLCDPPFSSYFDLGFRFAVYPPEGS